PLEPKINILQANQIVKIQTKLLDKYTIINVENGIFGAFTERMKAPDFLIVPLEPSSFTATNDNSSRISTSGFYLITLLNNEYESNDSVHRHINQARTQDESANQINGNSQHKLAERYQNGWGIEMDLGKAFYWYQKSAESDNKIAQLTESNNEIAQLYLAKCYQNDPNTNEYLLIMQYANCGDLQNYLKNNFNNLTWNNKKALAFQIPNGLNYLHNENILHRDLHSRNIVIHNNNAKITDFGISKIENNSTIYMGLCGRIAYIDPQILINQKFQYIKPSDIYSYGVLMNKYRENTIPNTPDNYVNLYKRCWDQEPEKRPTTMDILEEFSKIDFIEESGKIIHENNAKITDFGISKIENNSTMHIGIFGKIAYMEPQILADKNFKYIKPSDIYSYGVLMWEITSGYSPFKDKFSDNNDLINAITYYKVRETAIQGTPKVYEKLYKKCWNQKPKQRPTIKKVLEEFLKMGFGNSITAESAKIVNDDNNSDSESQFGNSVQLDTYADLS
ncbi:10393_t:CDS:2, partial [Funneliformis geosporum]